MSTTRTRQRPASTGRPGGRSGRRPPRRNPVPLLFGVAVLGLLGLAFALSSAGTDAVGPQTASVDVSGEALPAFVSGQPDPAVGMEAPELRGVGFDGEAVEVEPGGRPLVVLFAAHWCQYCQAEVAELAPWLAEGRAEDLGVDVVAVSTGVDPKAPNYPPSAWFAREGWAEPVLLDSESGFAADSYGLSGYPFFVFVDADSTVVGRASGALGTEAFGELLGRLAG